MPIDGIRSGEALFPTDRSRNLARMSDSGGDPSAHIILTINGAGLSFEHEVDFAKALQVMNFVGAGGDLVPADSGEPSGDRGARTAASTRRKAAARKKPAGDKAKAKRRAGITAVAKDMSLRPKGKTPFVEFAAEKDPRNHQEKQAVAVAWMKEEAGVAAITIAHVNACYVGANWPRPTDLENSLQQTASKKGWLDTGDMDDIKLSVPGEDFVRHDLPKAAKKK